MHGIPLEEYWTLGRSITIPALSNQAKSQLLFSAWGLLPCVSQEEIKNHVGSVWYFTLIWDMLQVSTLCVVTLMLRRSVGPAVCASPWSLPPSPQRWDDKQNCPGVHEAFPPQITWDWEARLVWSARSGGPPTGHRSSGLWASPNCQPSDMSTKGASAQAFTFPNSHWEA